MTSSRLQDLTCIPYVILFPGTSSKNKRKKKCQSECNNPHELTNLAIEGHMDQRLWSLLPEHLLDRILACLPLPSLLSMRSVCKRWSTLLSTPSFMNVCTEVPQKPSSSMLGLFEKGEQGCITQGCFTFCSVTQKWYTIGLSPLPVNEGSQLASTEGLFCYIPLVDGEDGDCLVVCNPLTRAWKSLLLPEGIQMLSLLAITVDVVSHTYKVIVVALMQANMEAGPRLDGYNLITQVYDSTSETWNVTRRLPPGLQFPLHSILCNGKLYGWCSKADQIWIYDIDLGVWRGEQLRNIPDEARTSNAHFVECQGRVLFVTETGYTGLRPQIWELNLYTMVCTEVAQVPPDLFQRFFECVCEFQCVGYNDAICFIAHESPELLTFHVVKKRWLWLPKCPEFPDWHPYGYVGVPLKLRLDIPV